MSFRNLIPKLWFFEEQKSRWETNEIERKNLH